MNKKIILIPAIALGLVGLYTGVAKASFFGSKNADMTTTLSQKLGVSEDKISQAFDEIASDRQAEIQSRHEEHLQSLVDEGKLTSAQKDSLVAKLAEMRTKRESEQAEFVKWASDNGIELDELGIGRGMGMKGMRGPRN